MVRWRGRRQSGNVEDRRGERSPSGFPFGRGGGRGVRFPFPGGGGRGGRKSGIGLVGMLVIVGVMLLFGVDPRVLLEGGLQQSQGPGAGFPDIQMPRALFDHTEPFDGPEQPIGSVAKLARSNRSRCVLRLHSWIIQTAGAMVQTRDRDRRD